jgi:uncharacterized protein
MSHKKLKHLKKKIQLAHEHVVIQGKRGLKGVYRVCEQVVVGILVFLFGYFFLAVSAFGATYPAYQGYVNDYVHLLSQPVHDKLEQELRSYEQKTTNEIVVVTVDSTNDESIEEYAVGLEEQWKVGKEGKDNGIIFLIAKNDRKMRVEVGYGLEGELTDGGAGEIIRTVVAPSFREGNYEKGIVDGTHSILSALGEDVTGPDIAVGNNPIRKSTGSKIDNLISAAGPFIFFVPMLFIYLFSYMARTKGIMLGGVVGGIGGGLLGLALGTVGSILSTVLVGGILGLVLDWLLSRNYQQHARQNRPTDWFNTWGGFRGGGGGDGGGFGGFGGGSSGGGGASGGW